MVCLHLTRHPKHATTIFTHLRTYSDGVINLIHHTQHQSSFPSHTALECGCYYYYTDIIIIIIMFNILLFQL